MGHCEMRRVFFIPAAALAALLACHPKAQARNGQRSAPSPIRPEGSGQAVRPSKSPRTLESFDLPWGSPQAPCVAKIESPTGSEEGDIRLRITAPGRADSIFTLPGTIVPLKDGLDPELMKDNLLASRFLYLCPKLKDTNGRPALVFCGWAYASDPGSLCILWPDGDRAPSPAFASDTFELTAVESADQTGLPAIIGRTSLSEGMGEGLETYDPFSAFRMGSGRKAAYDLALSRAYNQQHYCWTDLTDKKGLLVVTNSPDGKAKLLPEGEARSLAATNRTKPD